MPKTLTLNNAARKKVPPTMMPSPKEDTPSVKVMHRRAGPVNNTAKKHDNSLKPPATLVKTWLWMARDASDYELKKLGKNNIIRIFGSVESAHDYIANGGK